MPELVGEPETLIVDSTLLGVLHPREVSQSGGWGVLRRGQRGLGGARSRFTG